MVAEWDRASGQCPANKGRLTLCHREKAPKGSRNGGARRVKTTASRGERGRDARRAALRFRAAWSGPKAKRGNGAIAGGYCQFTSAFAETAPSRIEARCLRHPTPTQFQWNTRHYTGFDVADLQV